MKSVCVDDRNRVGLLFFCVYAGWKVFSNVGSVFGVFIVSVCDLTVGNEVGTDVKNMPGIRPSQPVPEHPLTLLEYSLNGGISHS